MRHTLFTLLFLLLAIPLHAQDGVALLCSPRQGSILLRWAPTSPTAWRLGNEYGYTIKRYTLLKGKKIPKGTPSVRLNSAPMKPSPMEEWEGALQKDKYIGIAAACIFGTELEGAPSVTGPFSAYKKHKEEQQRYSFALYAADQSIGAARLSGLFWEDKTSLPDEKYLYKVFINAPDSLALDTARAFTGQAEYHPLPKPLEPKAEWGDKSVFLSWNTFYQKHIYNSYTIEKSTDNGKTYKPLGDNAAIQVSDKDANPYFMGKTDSLPSNRDSVFYRIRGVSAFGESGPPSDPVSGTGMPPIKTAPVIVSYDVEQNRIVHLAWDYPEEMDRYITGFKIYRSTKPIGKKQLIYKGGEPSRRDYADSTAGFTNYYLISVFNKQKEKLSPAHTFVERVDSFPPAPPVHCAGQVDSTGRVTLSWLGNTEDDLDGYRVYRGNDPKFEFMQTAPAVIKDTVYTEQISLKVLNEHVYYKIKAIDLRQNQSGFSVPITIKRPDIIPPVAPVLKDVAEGKGGVELFWVNSSSKDAVRHLVYRKTMEDTLFSKIAEIGYDGEKRSSYLDKGIEDGKEYTYYIKAQDGSGLFSKASNQGYCKTRTKESLSIKLRKKELADRVTLSWTIKNGPEIERVLIYRQTNDAPLRLYGNSTGEGFTDKNIALDNRYRYCIRLVYKDGGSSALSKTITVKM